MKDDPCRCHDSHAAVVPLHSGHCCFFPADQTCHPQELAAWTAANAKRWERWQPGDVVLDAEGDLWTRASAASVRDGWPWSLGSDGSTNQPPEGGVAGYGPHSPVRPLVLLVRGGQAVTR